MDGAMTRSTPFVAAVEITGAWPADTQAKALWVNNSSAGDVVLTIQPKYNGTTTLPVRLPAGFCGVVPMSTSSLVLDSAATTARSAGQLQIIAGLQ